MAVPNRTEVLDDLYTTTWNNRKSGITDQIFENSPVFDRLKSLGGIQLNGTGGRYLEIPLSFAKNETITSLDKGDTISLSETKFLTVAQFEWRFVAGAIIRYYTDDARNKSRQQHLNLANAKIDNLRDSLTSKFEEYMFGDGTGNGGKDLDGLGNLVDTTPTVARTVGNIAQTTYSWWQNRQKTATGAASVYLLSDMHNLYNTCSLARTLDAPNMIVTTQTIYELYTEETQEQKQIVNVNKAGDPMFSSVQFMGIPITWSTQCASGRMYMLNSRFIGLNVDPDINFTATEWKVIPNQLDRVQQVVWKGNMISSRRKSLGVMTAIAA